MQLPLAVVKFFGMRQLLAAAVQSNFNNKARPS